MNKRNGGCFNAISTNKYCLYPLESDGQKGITLEQMYKNGMTGSICCSNIKQGKYVKYRYSNTLVTSKL